MFVFGQSGCIRGKICCIRAKLVLFGQTGCTLTKVFVFMTNSGCIRARLLYSGKVVVFCEKVVRFWVKMVVFEQSGCIPGKSGFNRANVALFVQSGCIKKKSGCIRSKVVVYG